MYDRLDSGVQYQLISDRKDTYSLAWHIRNGDVYAEVNYSLPYLGCMHVGCTVLFIMSCLSSPSAWAEKGGLRRLNGLLALDQQHGADYMSAVVVLISCC